MIKVSEHSAPIYPGEDVTTHPSADDSRVKPWLDHLVQLGVIDNSKELLMLKPGTLRRGIGPKGYMWRMEWEEV